MFGVWVVGVVLFVDCFLVEWFFDEVWCLFFEGFDVFEVYCR